MPLQPLARWNSGVAFFTPASNSDSSPGFTSICAISRNMLVLPLLWFAGRCDIDAAQAGAVQRRADEAGGTHLVEEFVDNGKASGVALGHDHRLLHGEEILGQDAAPRQSRLRLDQ